jgi:aminoglycoside phosphotransferase (APT) family kinase protein
MNEQISHLETRFKGYLQSKIPKAQNLTLANFIQMTEGFSYETYLVDAQWIMGPEEVSQGFAIRRVPAAGAVEPYNIKAQYRILEVVENTPVPAPKPYWLEMDESILGRPFFVMEKVEGEVPIPWGFENHEMFKDPERRLKMARNLIQVLADYQAIDWRKTCVDFLPVPQKPTDPAEFELERWEQNIQKFKIYPQPLLKEVYYWLRENKPYSPIFTLTHSDFRLGNFIWRDDRIVAFLDWEMPGIGDPMADLAWMCLKILRSPDSNLMCMLIEREDLYRYYQELTGISVDESRVFYWEVMGYFKLAAVFISAIRAFSEGKNRDVRLITLQDSVHYACLKELTELLKF